MTARLLLAAAGLLLAAPAFADVVQFGASKDNTIYQNTDNSNGAGDHIFAGRAAALNPNPVRRALLAFDLTSIPAGSTINSVTLRLRLSRASSSTLRLTSLHRVLADWGEGTSDAGAGGVGIGEGDGVPATANDATWNNRFHPATAWTTLGGDFEATPSASLNVGAINNFYTFGSTAGMVADVQLWLDNPAQSFGWIVRGVETSAATAKRFDSRTFVTEANRPLLTVDYTPPATAVGDGPGRNAVVELHPVAPNPSPAGVVLRFRLAQPGRVRVSIHDARGRVVASLVDAELPAGDHAAPWNAVDAMGSAVRSGVYWAQVNASGARATRSFVIAR